MNLRVSKGCGERHIFFSPILEMVTCFLRFTHWLHVSQLCSGCIIFSRLAIHDTCSALFFIKEKIATFERPKPRDDKTDNAKETVKGIRSESYFEVSGNKVWISCMLCNSCKRILEEYNALTIKPQGEVQRFREGSILHKN